MDIYSFSSGLLVNIGGFLYRGMITQKRKTAAKCRLLCFIAHEDRVIIFFFWLKLSIFPSSLLLPFFSFSFNFFLSLPFSHSPPLTIFFSLSPDWLVSRLSPIVAYPGKLPIKYVNSIWTRFLVRVLHQIHCGQLDTTRGVSSAQQGRISNLHHHNVPVTAQGLINFYNSRHTGHGFSL